MLGKSLSSSFLTLDSVTCFGHSTPNLLTATPKGVPFVGFQPNLGRLATISGFSSKKWVLCSTAQVESLKSRDDDPQIWEACRESLSSFDFSIEEKNNILGKAFGHVRSPFWSEERKKETPKAEIVRQILDYLRSLSLSDDDLFKLLKKFPEVLGCNLEQEMKPNVLILEKDWGIKGRSLRNLLLRNPVLGYNVDCKGDCMARCTRCWVRF